MEKDKGFNIKLRNQMKIRNWKKMYTIGVLIKCLRNGIDLDNYHFEKDQNEYKKYKAVKEQSIGVNGKNNMQLHVDSDEKMRWYLNVRTNSRKSVVTE